MKVNGVPQRSVQLCDDQVTIEVINQPLLPHRFERLRLSDWEAAARAIKTMQIRGAPLIGAVGAYGLAFALREDPSDTQLTHCKEALFETRPTAVNLRWALDRVSAAVARDGRQGGK